MSTPSHLIFFALSDSFPTTFAVCSSLLLAGAVAFGIIEYLRHEKLNVEHKKLRGDFTRANERAASFRGEKGHILRIVEQQIAEPLGELSRQLDKASAESASPKAAAMFHQAAEQLNRIRSGVETLTEIQTLDDRSRSVSLGTINVGAVVHEAASAARDAAAKKSIRLSLPAPSKASLARGDATLLRKVVTTLVYQAIEVSPIAAAVSLSLYQTSDRVLIAINDEGPGAVSSDHAHVLSQSGDSRPPTSFNAGNAPLNLAMAHNLVKAMEGWLWSQSEPGRGTTHVVELPLPSKIADAPFIASR